MKYLSVNLTKLVHNLYAESYTNPMKENQKFK